MKSSLGLCAVLLATACAPRSERLSHSRPVIARWDYVDADRRNVDDLTTDSTPLYKLYGTVLVPVKKLDGSPITWGEWRFASGQIDFTCRNGETEVHFELIGLLPNSIYTVWLALHEPPGFRERGNASIIGLTPVGPLDGSRGVLQTDSNGQGKLDSSLLAGAVAFPVPDKPVPEVPGCAMDAYQFSISLQYKLDGSPHGDDPGDPNKVATQLMWLVTYGQAENAETF